MRTMPLLWREVEDFEPLITTAVAMLSIEPAAEVAIRSYLIRRGAVAENVAVKLFDTETRLQQRARLGRRLLVEGEEPAALMEVRRRIGRVERVEIEVVKLLRKDREARCQSIVAVDDVIETRKRVEALALDVALVLVERFEARHVRADETILETLKEEELVFLDWTADSDARCGGADTIELSVAPAWPRQHAQKQVAQIVAARARLDRRHCSRKFSELGRIRIRVYFYP